MEKNEWYKVLSWAVAPVGQTVEVALSLQVISHENRGRQIDVNLSFWKSDLKTKAIDGCTGRVRFLRGGDYLMPINKWSGCLFFENEQVYSEFFDSIYQAAGLILWGYEIRHPDKHNYWRARTRLMMNYIVNNDPKKVWIQESYIVLDDTTVGFAFCEIEMAEAVGALIMYARKNNKIGLLPSGKLCSRDEFREMVKATGLTQAALADQLGMSQRGLRMAIADDSATTKTHHNYCQQYAVQQINGWIRFDSVGGLEKPWRDDMSKIDLPPLP